MTFKKIIVWQKWYDPYGSDDLEDMLGYGSVYEEEEGEDYTEPNETQANEPQGADSDFGPKFPAMATPFGVIPLTDNTSIGKNFNFWIGHTNFDITEDIGLQLEALEGIETLDIYTRYRFRIGVGKAFSDSETMRQITSSLCEDYDNIN